MTGSGNQNVQINKKKLDPSGFSIDKSDPAACSPFAGRVKRKMGRVREISPNQEITFKIELLKYRAY